MQGAELRRRALFALLCASLVASALAFATGGGRSGMGEKGPVARPLRPAERPPPATERAVVRAQRLLTELRRSARGFLVAFLRYEAGDAGPGVAAALRATATPRFARRLLAAPPRAPSGGGFPPPARLRGFQLSFVSPTATQALISGAARRGGRAEQFSFLFERRRDGWQARGPGQ